MRILLPTLLAMLVLAPAAAAQTDGCLAANPCLFDVEVDEAGIASVSITNMTTGDWFTLAVSNLDEVAHTVSFAGVQVQVGAYAFADSQPFQAPGPGAYVLADQPTGDQATVQVLAGDVVDAESGTTTKANGSPSTGFVLVAVGLVALAVARRQ